MASVLDTVDTAAYCGRLMVMVVDLEAQEELQSSSHIVCSMGHLPSSVVVLWWKYSLAHEARYPTLLAADVLKDDLAWELLFAEVLHQDASARSACPYSFRSDNMHRRKWGLSRLRTVCVLKMTVVLVALPLKEPVIDLHFCYSA